MNQARPNSCIALRSDLQAESEKLFIQKSSGGVGNGLIYWSIMHLCFTAPRLAMSPSMRGRDLMNSNVKAPFFIAQAAAELAKHRGVIVNITDMHAERP